MAEVVTILGRHSQVPTARWWSWSQSRRSASRITRAWASLR